jgi:hypothetical protein
MRVVFSNIARNTGSSSPVEVLMTCSTCDVAVCCSSASVSSRALLLGFEQPHVLDGDHRLVGESLQQLNVLVGERRDAVSGNHDCSHGGTVVQHGDREGGSIPDCCSDRERILAILCDVCDVDGDATQYRPARHASAARGHRIYPLQQI